MRYILILIALIPINSLAFKQTDFACMADCASKGYQYNFCQAQCSFETAPNTTYQYQPMPPMQQMPPIKQTDYKCVTDCTSKGYMYNYCTSVCSF